jgi:SAM-dependent methyltransferase
MGYYNERLAGRRLERCYEVAPPRVRQYLEAEIRHLAERLEEAAAVLELGCGYGRVTLRLARGGRRVVGIDTARVSLALARRRTPPAARCSYLEMTASELGLASGSFDAVVCVQNGICAFGVDQAALVREALRVTRAGGRLLFSTYAESFWPHRLAWFEAQAAAGLMGAVDHAESGDGVIACGDGVIACTDGFRSGLVRREHWAQLWDGLGPAPIVTEVDGSSLFCELVRE